jgi:hypothetical protein
MWAGIVVFTRAISGGLETSIYLAATFYSGKCLRHWKKPKPKLDRSDCLATATDRLGCLRGDHGKSTEACRVPLTQRIPFFREQNA